MDSIENYTDSGRASSSGDGSVDLKDRSILKNNTSNWRACLFVLGIECCDGMATFSLTTNLVTYLTTKLHEGNAIAARNVSIWQGTCYLTSLIGAVVADAYLGLYWTLVVSSMVYSIGMSIIALSASIPALKPPECLGSLCPAATPTQYAFFYLGLYVVALGTGGVVVASVPKQNLVVPNDTSLLHETPVKRSAAVGSRILEHSDDLK
ncbi:hypothetical protein RIF29_26664 [Crotalaria pallida]|uniref:Uncharacterized protein n=1 Tax=Crotalaria pallida TaxID=3830 RepID=A0AAN9EMY2_CROPI